MKHRADFQFRNGVDEAANPYQLDVVEAVHLFAFGFSTFADDIIGFVAAIAPRPGDGLARSGARVPSAPLAP